MTTWATSGQVKIERAQEHIADLRARSHGFFEPPPYTIVREYDTGAGELVFRWQRQPDARPIPLIWGAIAGDAIHNLGSCLDILWRQATNPSPGKRDPRGRGAHFPFNRSAATLKERISRETHPATKAALKIAFAFRPYESEHHSLWLLNRAGNLDKHEVPAIVVAAARQARFSTIQTIEMEKIVHLVTSSGPLMPVEDGKVFFRTAVPMPMRPDDMLQATFGLAFGDFGPLKDRPVLGTLNEFAGIVEAISLAFIRDGLLT